MVSRGAALAVVAVTWWTLAQQEQSLLLRLAPKDRMRVLAAMLLLVTLCLGLMVFVLWCARWARRYASRPTSHRDPSRPAADDWADKPLPEGDDRDDDAQ